MTKPPSIAPSTNAIIRKLLPEIEPRYVKKMTLTPKAAIITLYRHDENGDKYILNGKPATYTRRIKVRT